MFNHMNIYSVHACSHDGRICSAQFASDEKLVQAKGREGLSFTCLKHYSNAFCQAVNAGTAPMEKHRAPTAGLHISVIRWGRYRLRPCPPAAPALTICACFMTARACRLPASCSLPSRLPEGASTPSSLRISEATSHNSEHKSPQTNERHAIKQTK